MSSDRSSAAHFLTSKEERALRGDLAEAMKVLQTHFDLKFRWKGDRKILSGRWAYQVHARGRVQGVFFRAWTREQADELSVGGWVRNCPDGSVEAHLEGSRAGIQELVERMRRGPAGARVDELTFDEVEPEDLIEFEVRL